MASNAQINILINAAQSAKTLNQLESSLNDINQELKNLEIGSDAFNELKKQADLTAKSINNINISGFEGRLKGFEATTKTISSSLSLATGSMALFGTESEETTKALARVQGAMAISTAFKDFAEAQKAADESGKGLNKTLLGNPFVLILAALLPLLLQMDSFKEIMNTVGGVAKELFASLKPLIDAFMFLLQSVFKALLPIIVQISNVLIKALQPVIKVITTVLKALNPLFEELGKFLSENTFLIDALTTALELTLLPLQLLISGLEALNLVDTSKPAEGIKSIEVSAEEAEKQLKSLIENVSQLFTLADEKLEKDEREIQLSEAKGKSEAELNKMRRRAFQAAKKENESILESLDLQIKVQEQQKKDTTELVELREKALKRQQDQIFRFNLFEAGIDKDRRDRNLQRTKDLQKAADDIQKSYLELRGIQREITEEFTTRENERFLGFFVDFRKRLGDVIGQITEGTQEEFSELKKFFDETFKEPNSFSKFVQKYKASGDAIETNTNQVSQTFQNFADDFSKVFDKVGENIEKNVTDGGVLEGYRKLFNELRKTSNDIERLIIKDAIVFDKRLESTIGDLRKDPNSVLNFLSVKFTEFKKLLDEGFDFSIAPVRSTEYQVLQSVIKDNINSINKLLNDSEAEFTIVQRDRLTETRNALINFREEYEKSIREFPIEDLEQLLTKPLVRGFSEIFRSLKVGTNEVFLEYSKFDEAVRRIDPTFELTVLTEKANRKVNDLELEIKKINIELGKEGLGAKEIEKLNRAADVASEKIQKIKSDATNFTTELVKTGFNEYLVAVTDSLQSLGFQTDVIEKALSKVIFDTTQEKLKQEDLFLRRQLESPNLVGAEREKVERKITETRLKILEAEKERAGQLAEEEGVRRELAFKKIIDGQVRLLKRQREDNLITEEEFQEGVVAINQSFEKQKAEDAIKVQKEKAEVIKNIEKDINDVIKFEQLRRLQQFADSFDRVIDGIVQASQIGNDILQNLSEQQLINLDAAFQTQVSQLEGLKNQGLLTQREFDFERLKAQEKYEKSRKRLEKEAWERNYAVQLGSSIINTAVAVTQALAQFPGPPFTIPNSILAGILGAAQTTVIATQPKPRFREGGLVGGSGSGDSDTISALVSSGEFIMNSQATKRFLPLLRQLNQFDRPTIGQRETVSSPPISDLPKEEPIRAYVVLDELNEKNEVLRRINDDNIFFRS